MDSIRASTMGAAVAVALALYGPLALAQEAAAPQSGAQEQSGQLEEVVITAQKRTEKLEDVPVSAQVVSTDTLANSNVSDVSDLNKLVPSVNINGTISGRAPMGIRGISSVSNEQAVGVPSGVAIMIDGVPVPSDSYDGNQVEDMQSVEVLKGPQATLGGRTAASGIINYITYDPTDHLVGGVSVTGTTDSEYRSSGHISGPLSDAFEYSLSAYDANRYYPVTNTFYDQKTGQRDNGLRAKLLWKVTEDIDAKLTFHHGMVQTYGGNFVYVHTTPGADLLATPTPLTQALLLPGITPSWTNLNYDSPVNSVGHRQNDNDASLDLNFNLGGGYTLASTSAYQHETQQQIQDLFATAVYFWDTLQGGPPFRPVTSDPKLFDDTQHQREFISQKSEELKLVSPEDRPFSFVAGLFYSDTSTHMIYTRALPPAALNVDVTPETATYDIYGRSTWKFAPSTSLVTGLRYNADQLKYRYDQVIFNGEGPYKSSGSNNSSALVGDISLQQQFLPDVMGYASYARGYSPKVYNTAATLTSDAEIPPVGQEHINHFEIGTKGSYLDRRLTLNLAVFDTIYQDYQIQAYSVVPGHITSDLSLYAAGKAETRGVEFDTNWRPAQLTTLGFDAAYTDAVFKEWTGAPCEPDAVPNTPPANCTLSNGAYVQNMSGNVMPNAPKFKFTLNGEQRVPLGGAPYELVFAGNYSYRTSAQMLSDNNPNGIMGAFGILDLSAGFQNAGGKWSVTAFCNNVFNKIYYQDVEDFFSSPWSGASTVIAQPARDAQRYGGIRLTANL